MKIRYGKYILNAKEALRMLQKQEQRIANIENHKKSVAQYAKSILSLHQPYWRGNHNGGFDLSTTRNEGLRETLSARIGKELWCCHCRNPWPCQMVEPLRALHNALAYSDFDAVIPEPIEQPSHENLIAVAL